jgi:hypothetical protein
MDQTTYARPAGRRLLPRLSILCLVAVVAALAVAPAAFAQETSLRGYVGQGGNTLAQVSQGGQPPAAEASADGTLAFTGLDIGLMAGGGLLLLGVGATMARMLRTQRS